MGRHTRTRWTLAVTLFLGGLLGVPSAPAQAPADDTELRETLSRAEESYLQRMARLEKLRALADEAGDVAMVEEIDGLLERNELAFERRIERLRARHGDRVDRARRDVRERRRRQRTGDVEPVAEGDDTLRRRRRDGDRDADTGHTTDRDRRRRQRTGDVEPVVRDDHDDDDRRDAHRAGRAHGSKLVTICWAPPGNPANRRTKRVSESALDVFLDMGATLGPCDGDERPGVGRGRGRGNAHGRGGGDDDDRSSSRRRSGKDRGDVDEEDDGDEDRARGGDPTGRGRGRSASGSGTSDEPGATEPAGGRGQRKGRGNSSSGGGKPTDPGRGRSRGGGNEKDD